MAPVSARRATRPAPTALSNAERARTLVACASQLRVGIANLTHEVPRHVVDVDGSLIFLAPADSPASVLRLAPRLPSPTVTATLTDVTVVPQADRVRGRLRLTGPLALVTEPLPAQVRPYLDGPDPQPDAASATVLRLVPQRVALTWRCELPHSAGPEQARAVDVAVGDYRSARTDPLAGCEATWLPHLHADHGRVLQRLASYAAGPLPAGTDVRPVVLDQHGVVLRLHVEGRSRDLRLAFAQRVTCGCDVRPAFDELLARARP